MPKTRTILHIDMDAFFTSVEQRDNPSYQGKPVIVGAAPGMRGVVSAASYEARKFGVRSAMPISEAYERCPHGVFLPVRMEAYGRESGIIMDILHRFSPMLEQVSVDEAFLDITGTEKLWGDAPAAARMIADRIHDERRLSASVGIAPNKFLAKVASDLHKPNGITHAPFDAQGIIDWLAPLPVGKIWGVGKKTEAVFHQMGIRIIGDLQQLSRKQLVDRFGVNGEGLHELCRGLDDRPVSAGEEAKSISREHTFDQNTDNRDEVKRVLLSLSQDVAEQARHSGVKGRTVYLIYRTSTFTKHTRRVTLSAPTCVAKEIYDLVIAMLDDVPWREKVRLIGVGITGFDTGGEVQTSLFDDPRASEKWEASERAVDKVTAKIGKKKVFRGGEMDVGQGERPDDSAQRAMAANRLLPPDS
jgi:DNA polymerase IV